MNQFWCVFCPQRSHWPSISPRQNTTSPPQRNRWTWRATPQLKPFNPFSNWLYDLFWIVVVMQLASLRIVGLGLGLVGFSCEVKPNKNLPLNEWSHGHLQFHVTKEPGVEKMITANWCVNVRWSLGEEFTMSYDETSICNIKRIEYQYPLGKKLRSWSSFSYAWMHMYIHIYIFFFDLYIYIDIHAAWSWK